MDFYLACETKNYIYSRFFQLRLLLALAGTDIIVSPFFSFSKRSHSARLADGSRPDVGSSSNTTRDDPHIAAPTESRRFCPPDRLLDKTSLCKTINNPRVLHLSIFFVDVVKRN